MKSKLLNINKYITALLIGLSGVLGIIGYLIYYKHNGISYYITDLFYDVIKLFIIDSNFTSQQVNIFLNIARFLAPLSLATAIIKWLLKNFAHQINRQKVKLFDNHIIICGNAESNSLLIQDIRENKKEDYIFAKKETTEESSANIIDYQIINYSFIADIAFYKSRYMIVSFKDDVESLYFINKLLQVVDLNKIQHKIDIIILFNNPRWAELSNDMGMLKNISNKVNKSKYLNVRYLNYIDKAIRKHMLIYAPDTIKPITNISDPALAVGVIGNRTIMQRLIINMALTSHYINHKKLIVYVAVNSFDKFAAFIKMYQLNYMIEIINIELEDLYNKNDISSIYICENDELKIMQNVKALQESDYLNSVQRYIFIDNSNNISVLLDDKYTKIIDISKEIGVFDNIIDESLDDAAKTIHNDYIAKLIKENKLIADKETHQEWNMLSDEIKDRNRFQMDHLGVKIRSLGCKTAPISSPKNIFDWNNDTRLEDLSKAEHNRWNAYMYYKGWKFGKIKDEHKKTHPDLISYEELEDYIKQYDRNTIKNIPILLKQLKLKAIKE